MIINSFPKIVKDILKSLPKNDYPVLNTRLDVKCWLAYALNNSLTSMRDLFKRLNNIKIKKKSHMIKLSAMVSWLLIHSYINKIFTSCD
jgi:hypothetical protein